DIVIEVLVGRKLEHGDSSLTASSQEAMPNPDRVELRLVLTTYRIGQTSAVAQIALNVFGMVEHIADDGIHFSKPQGWILLHDSLRRHSFAKRGDDGVKGHATAADAQHAIGIFIDGDRFDAH